MEKRDGAAAAAAAAAVGATLIVKHLPDALPLHTLRRLFSHYDASDVRPCSAARLKNCAFVDFKDEALAARAQSQLHRLRFLGKILAVERAKPYSEVQVSQASDRTEAAEGNPPPLPPMPAPCIPIHKLEPIAPGLAVDYPFPPHLEYAYPPPDGNILINIVNALIAVPRFYTQVLHLMNKMNLPAPFRPALPTPPLPPPPRVPSPPKQQDRELSSDESELESSEEGQKSEGNILRAHKRAKVNEKDVEDSGPKATSLVPRERAIVKKHHPVLQINISTRGLHEGIKVEHTRDESVVAATDETEIAEMSDTKPCATIEELEAGRMPMSEILALPMFKNYAVGNPTPVLYIKNLAKDVSQDDLFYVFGAFFSNIEDAKTHLGVKLMQEGRMRGQSFITFPSIELAKDALNVSHGYVLKGKPMIIQFGRNPLSAKANADSCS